MFFKFVSIAATALIVFVGSSQSYPTVNEATVEVTKETPTAVIQEEHLEKSSGNNEVEVEVINTDDETTIDKSKIKNTQKSVSNRTTEKTNDDESSVTTIDEDYEENIHGKANGKTLSITPTETLDRTSEMERNTEKEVEGTTTENTLNNGNSEYSSSGVGRKETEETKTQDEITTKDDGDKIQKERDNVEINTLDDVTISNDKTKIKEVEPLGYTEIGNEHQTMDETRIEDKTGQTKKEVFMPEKQILFSGTQDEIDVTDYYKDENLNKIIRSTPIATFIIADENGIETNEGNIKKHEESTKLLRDEKGNFQTVHQSVLKDQTEGSKQHVNVVKIAKIPKIQRISPLIINFKSSGVDNANNIEEKEKDKATLTGKANGEITLEHKNEKSLKEIEYSADDDTCGDCEEKENGQN